MRGAWKRIPKKVDPELDEARKEIPLEKGDFPAMLIAALVTLVLPALLILLAICGVVMGVMLLAGG